MASATNTKGGPMASATGLFEKIRGNIFIIPEDRMEKLASGKGYGDSFVYLVAIVLINAAGSLLVSVLLSLLLGKGVAASLGLLAVSVIVSIPMSYAFAGVLYALLRLFGGKANCLQTVQVAIYGNTCSSVFGFIPIVGFLASLVSLSNMVLGFRRVHKLGLWKVIAAVLIFLALTVAAVVLLALLTGPLMGVPPY